MYVFNFCVIVNINFTSQSYKGEISKWNVRIRRLSLSCSQDRWNFPIAQIVLGPRDESKKSRCFCVVIDHENPSRIARYVTDVKSLSRNLAHTDTMDRVARIYYLLFVNGRQFVKFRLSTSGTRFTSVQRRAIHCHPGSDV